MFSGFLLKCLRVPAASCHQVLFGLLNLVMFIYAGTCIPMGIRLILVWIYLFCLTAEACVDIREMVISDEVLLLMVLTGAGYLLTGGVSWQDSAAGGISGILLLGLIHFLSKGGLGLGDVKFAGALGIWLGIPGILICLALAFVTGGTAALLLCVFRKASLKTRIPFGPFLSLGAAVSFFFSNAVLHWYYSLFV